MDEWVICLLKIFNISSPDGLGSTIEMSNAFLSFIRVKRFFFGRFIVKMKKPFQLCCRSYRNFKKENKLFNGTGNQNMLRVLTSITKRRHYV